MTDADFSYQSDETYTYDDNGNRTNAGYSTGTNNQLLSDGTYNYTYDDEGNRLTKTNIATGVVEEYEWDHRNRLVGVTTKDNANVVIEEVEYTYDAFDKRIQKSVDPDGIGLANPEIEIYVYSGDHLALVFDNANNIVQRFLHGFVIDQVLAQEEVNAVTGAIDEVFWTLGDHQGTLRDVMDNSGVLVDHLEYDSFGNVTAQTDPTVDLRFRYTGREWDAETGLHQYRARYYDANVGRFISEAPIGFEAGVLIFSRYVNNSPVNFVDPTGQSIESGWDAASLGIGLGSLGHNLYYLKFGAAALDGVGVLVDGVALAAPGVPGGVGAVIGTWRYGDEVVPGGGALLKGSDEAVDTVKGGSKLPPPKSPDLPSHPGKSPDVPGKPGDGPSAGPGKPADDVPGGNHPGKDVPPKDPDKPGDTGNSTGGNDTGSGGSGDNGTGTGSGGSGGDSGLESGGTLSKCNQEKLLPSRVRQLEGLINADGTDIHKYKGKGGGKKDFFVDKETARIYLKPKDGSGPGEYTGYNISEL